MKDRVSNGRMCCKEPLMLRSGRLQSRQVAGRARGAGLPAPGLAEGRAHCGANRVGACCGEGQGAEQAHLAGEEGRSSRSPMDPKTYNIRSVTRSGASRNVNGRGPCPCAFAAVLRVHYSPLNCLSGSTGAVRVGEVVAQIAV